MDTEKHEINKGLKNVSNFREFHKDHEQCDLFFKSSQKSKPKIRLKTFLTSSRVVYIFQV